MSYTYDDTWPKPLPNDWVLGSVSDTAVDREDNIWVLHRPTTVEEGANAAPAVLKFDQTGHLLVGWEVDGAQTGDHAPVSSPKGAHGLAVDDDDNVWITLNHEHLVLKFSSNGELLLYIGTENLRGDNNDRQLLGGPADVAVDVAANELFVADGYDNNRIVVFDSESGEYKRSWGAYGLSPQSVGVNAEDADPLTSKLWIGPVHGVVRAHDGKVYVADRGGTLGGVRMQAFESDGKFLFQLNRPTADIALSADERQSLLYLAGVVSGEDSSITIIDRYTRKLVGRFSAPGLLAHGISVDTRGNVYTAGLYFSYLKKFRRNDSP